MTRFKIKRWLINQIIYYGMKQIIYITSLNHFIHCSICFEFSSKRFSIQALQQFFQFQFEKVFLTHFCQNSKPSNLTGLQPTTKLTRKPTYGSMWKPKNKPTYELTYQPKNHSAYKTTYKPNHKFTYKLTDSSTYKSTKRSKYESTYKQTYDSTYKSTKRSKYESTTKQTYDSMYKSTKRSKYESTNKQTYDSMYKPTMARARNEAKLWNPIWLAFEAKS